MPEEYTKEELLELVAHTTGLEERQFVMEDEAAIFEIDEDDDEQERLVLQLGAEKFPVTQEAYLEANKIVGLGKGYVQRTPVPYIVPHLNYWFDELGEERKALIRDGRIFTFVRPGTELYSIPEMIETICAALEERGYDDYYFEKVYHSIDLTQFAVVIPSLNRAINGGTELIYSGLFVQHSLLGKVPTVVSSYVHEDVADMRGGMISVQDTRKWNRKLGQWRVENDDMFEEEEIEVPDNVYNVFRWLESAVGEVIARANREFDSIEGLLNVEVGGHAGTFLNDVFTKYKVPTALQRAVREEYATMEGQTMYDMWKAIVAVSGRAEVAEKPGQMQDIMKVAGAIAAHPDKCDGCHRMK